MTFYTNRNNIEPKFRLIAFMVMVLFGLFGAIMTLQSIGSGQFTGDNGFINEFMCSCSLWMLFSIVITCASLFYFALFGLAVLFLSFSQNFSTFFCLPIMALEFSYSLFALFGLAVFFECFLVKFFSLTCLLVVYKTCFTTRPIALLFPRMLVKFGNWFNFVAFQALFCLNCFRHNQFLGNWLCLEVATRPTLVPTSLYSIGSRRHVNSKIIRNLAILSFFLFSGVCLAEDVKGNRIKNLGYPIVATDAASMQFVLDYTAAGGHDILSAAHGDTTTTGVPTRGSMMIANSTPKWAEVGIGAAGTIWRSDGTDPAWSATTNITSLGTIVTGVWQGTAIADTYVANDISLTSIAQAANVDLTGVATNDVLKYNGTNFVVVPYDQDLSFSIATFSDNEATTQLIGSGAWETTGNITFDATYNNGPPSAATITISSNDGGYSVWGTNPLVMSSPYATKDTTEDTYYPASRGQYVTFTLNTTPSDSDTETVTFQNYIWYGDGVKADTYLEADIEAETSTLSSDHTTSVSINAGAGEYLVFAYPTTYTQIPVGTDYEDDGAGTGFIFNSITCACALDNAALSITNTAGYAENYDVVVSTTANLGNHTLTTYSTAQTTNTIYWGYHTDTSATEATIEGLSGGSSAASNDNTRTFTVTTGANQYIYFAYPKRLGAVTFYVGGFEGGFESVDTDSVGNSNGWSEDYYSYRSSNANLGEVEVTTQ